jgi:hypothetical protein
MSHLVIDRLTAHWQIRFPSLFQEGRALAFPCDATGHVDLDALSERGRSNYLFAKAMVGRDFATPSVLFV